MTTSVRLPAVEDPDARLRLGFDTSSLSLTVGAEEELMLVDAGSGRLVPGIDAVLERLPRDAGFQPELRAAQVELASRPCLSAADVGRELAFSRLALEEAIGDGESLIACGTHPTAAAPGPLTDAPRYREVAADNPWAAQRMLTCGLHVHVGLADADRALAVHDALRSYLPELAVLSANSPYHESRHSGMASARLVLNRSLARHGVPPAFGDWSSYARLVAWGREGGSIPDTSYHWWDLRLHPAYGTLEVRVCDVQTEIPSTVALVALVQTLVAWLSERHDAGELLPVHDGYRIAESLWVAARSGARPELLDLETGSRQPALDRVTELVETLAPVARELGSEAELLRLPSLAALRGADRQQRVVRERGLGGLVDWLAHRTLESARGYCREATEDVPAPAPGRERPAPLPTSA